MKGLVNTLTGRSSGAGRENVMALKMKSLGAIGATWALVGMLGSVGGAQAALPTSLEPLSKARHELGIAIERAERSLAEHQPGSGHTKQHMQQVLNILEGKGGTDFKEKMENLGDGVGVLHYVTAAEQSLKQDKMDPTIQQALAHTRTFLEEAIDHAKRSIQGSGVQETHKHAALTAGLLVAGHGQEQSDSPVTGTLTYAVKRASATARP